MASYAKLLALAATPALFDAAPAGVSLCNWQCYLDRYPDLQDALGATNIEGAEIHYHNHGQSEGRDCTCPVVETCDWQCYLDRYPDLRDALGATNTRGAEIHYRDHGQSEGRDCTCPVVETCDWQCYLDRYPDLRDALGATNIRGAEIHYHNHGQSEGRDCTCPEACPRLDEWQRITCPVMSALVKNGDIVPDSACTVGKQETFMALLNIGISVKVAKETTEANFKSESCEKCPERVNLFEMNMIRGEGTKQGQGFDEPQEHFRSTGIRDQDSPDESKYNFAERNCLLDTQPSWTSAENKCLSLTWDRDPFFGIHSNDVNTDKRPRQCTNERESCLESQLHGAITFMFEEFGTPTGRDASISREEYKQLWLEAKYPREFELRSPRSCKGSIDEAHFGCSSCLSEGAFDSNAVNQKYCRCVLAVSQTPEWLHEDDKSEQKKEMRATFESTCGNLAFPSISTIQPLKAESKVTADCEPFCSASGSFFGP